MPHWAPAPFTDPRRHPQKIRPYTYGIVPHLITLVTCLPPMMSGGEVQTRQLYLVQNASRSIMLIEFVVVLIFLSIPGQLG